MTYGLSFSFNRVYDGISPYLTLRVLPDEGLQYDILLDDPSYQYIEGIPLGVTLTLIDPLGEFSDSDPYIVTNGMIQV